jgi:hypothetical protein
MTLALAIYVGGMRTMNRSKLYEWLLDNECPFEWDVDENSSTIKTVTLIFSKKEWEDED